MKAVIVSPEKTLFDGEVMKVTVPGEKGRFEILNNHAPIISCLISGTIICRGPQTCELDISGGFIEVVHNEILMCVEEPMV